jgi:hypothetical protein
MDPAMILRVRLEGIRESGNIRGRLSLGPGDADHARRLATQLIELQPDANDAATISCFRASGHDGLRFPVPFVPITEFVDTACPHNKNDHIRLRETKRFGKAVLGGGRPHNGFSIPIAHTKTRRPGALWWDLFGHGSKGQSNAPLKMSPNSCAISSETFVTIDLKSSTFGGSNLSGHLCRFCDSARAEAPSAAPTINLERSLVVSLACAMSFANLDGACRRLFRTWATIAGLVSPTFFAICYSACNFDPPYCLI